MAGKGVNVIGLGAGGHAKVVIEILRASGNFKLIGMLDARLELIGQNILGVPVLGDDKMLSELARQGVTRFFIGLGTVGKPAARRRLFELGLEHGMKPVDTIHPNAHISPSAAFGAGITIMAGAIINACASLGRNVIINTGAIVEHDCVLEDDVHVATGARLAGTVSVRRGAHIGAGATIREGITVGADAIVGAGAVVIRDVQPAAVVVGVPALPLRAELRTA